MESRIEDSNLLVRARLVRTGQFKHDLAQMLKEINGLPSAEGFGRVYYPGQIEGET